MKTKLLCSLISCMLFCATALFATESEPNNSRTTANTFALNSSNSGSISPAGDVDWWKVKTNKDGKLILTLTSNNSIFIRIYLYDNNGTLQLSTATTNSSYALQTDGLAPGTYYIKIIGYYNTQIGDYTLSNSLVGPTQANDAEPNGSRSTALALTQNSTKTGHIGYYYNNKRDSSDWYKITTSTDGELKVAFTSHNGQYIYCLLYDNNGTTLLNRATTNSSNSLIKDGLAAGTYYVQIRAYYSNGFTPYTVSDSLLTYTYANDKEPNNSAFQARTIPANGNADGHIGFYYNGVYERPDWWKINYTGGGSLTLNVRQNLHISDKAKQYYYVSIYKDTLVAPVSSTYYLGDAAINLSSLTPNYYYIRIVPYYATGYFAYRINPVFSQVHCGTLINVIDAAVGSNCTNSSITYICSNTQPPYKVQLYRFGVAYGSSVSTNSSHTFSSLPSGLYYAKAYADGATASCYGTSSVKSIVPKPTGLFTNNISAVQATLNWSTVTCAKYYSIQYRVSGTSTWTLKNTSGNVNNLQLKNLSTGTTYEWRVAANDSANNLIAKGTYTDIANFKTASAILTQRPGQRNLELTSAQELKIYPNPAKNSVIIDYRGNGSDLISIEIKDLTGRIVVSKKGFHESSLKSTSLDVSSLPAGVYVIIVGTSSHEFLTSRVIIQK